MKDRDVMLLKGKLHLECAGTQITAFIDQAVQENIHIEDIFWMDEHKVHVVVSLSDFYRLRKCSKRYQTRIKITQKRGVPFIWKRIKQRKMFFFGSVFFFFLLFFMTSVVWKVEIEGTGKFPVNQINTVLQSHGVFVGQLKVSLPKPAQIQHEILAQFPQLSWVGFRVEGTRVVVTVVEKKRTQIHKSKFPFHGPVHLISKKNGLIVDVRVEQGNPLVKVNDMVKKGQMLVSGIYGSPEQENGPIVGARGKIMGEVWYESDITIPLIQKHKVFTGARKKSSYGYIAGLILRNPFKSPPYSRYEITQHVHSFYLGKLKLPLGWIEEEYLESNEMINKLSIEEAVELGSILSRRSLSGSLSSEGTIQTEKILQRTVKRDKVYLKVHFDVIEDIAVPQPILRGE